jgi:competence protein ComEC
MKKACLVLLAGIYAPQLSSFSSHYDLLVVMMFAFVAGAATGRLLVPACFTAGYWLFIASAAQVVESRIEPQYVGDSIVTRVRVADFPRANGSSVSFPAEVLDSPWVPKRIRVSWFEPGDPPRFGDIWQLELRLRRPRGSASPGGFDYETWLFRERISATAYVVDSHRNRRLQSAVLGVVDARRQQVVDRLQSLAIDRDAIAILAAISVGARHLLTQGQWDRYARTGTNHLIAISGLHVGMVAAAAYGIGILLSVLVRRRGNHRRLATVVALLCACAYALLSGMAVPASRASLMLMIAAAAIIGRRPQQPFETIAVAAGFLAVLSPLVTLGPGFKLSFVAVAVLLWLARRMPPRNAYGLRARSGYRVGQLLTMQFGLLLGLMPLTVLLFSRVSLAAPVVNLLAVPVFGTVTVPATLLGLALPWPLHGLGDDLLRIAAGSLQLIDLLIAAAAALPMAATRVAALEGGAIAWLALTPLWVLLPRGWPCRGLAWLAAALVLTWTPPRPEDGCARVTVLDVGQGLAVSVETRSQNLLYDTGPSYRDGGSAAESVVLPYLWSRGVRRLSDVVVSHADLDHAGGFAAVAAALPVGRVFAGESAGLPAGTLRCAKGVSWQLDGVHFRFLYPLPRTAASGNDASCVLQVSTGRYRLLLPGDIERKAERHLLEAGMPGPVDVVIAPHHGSTTSSTAAFVRALRPSLVLVSAGYRNRWSLPDETVVERWERAGATVVSTAASGAIRFAMCREQGISPILREREEQRRIWHE